MYFKRDKIKEALKKSYENCKPHKIPKFNENLRNLQQALGFFEKSYEEGAKLEADTLNILGEYVHNALLWMNDSVSEKLKNNGNLKGFNPVDAVMAATDYMYLLCMDKLGCPDIPVGFNDEVKQSMVEMATKMEKSISLHNMPSTKTVFKEQRRIDALDLYNNRIGKALGAVETGHPSTRAVARLVAEYQALCQRQKGHTWIWRAFHSTENEARNLLIDRMKNSLKTVLGTDADIDKGDPRALAGDYAEFKIDLAFQKKMSARVERNGMEKILGIELNSSSLSFKKDMPNRENISLDKDNFSIFNDKDGQVSQPVQQQHKSIEVPQQQASTGDFSIL